MIQCPACGHPIDDKELARQDVNDGIECPACRRSWIVAAMGPSGAAGGAERSDTMGPSGAAGGAERSDTMGPSGAAGGAERSDTIEPPRLAAEELELACTD
jgi:hypothetical protein